MNGFNKVILAGNLTRDPELRYTPTGRAVAKFTLALNRKWRDESGELKDEVTFVDVEAWAKQAETIGQYLKKGSPLLMEGRLRTDSWEDKQTQQKRSKLMVVLDNFVLISSGTTREGGADFNPGGAPAARPSRPAAAPPPPPVSEGEPMPPEEDDVPF